MPVPGSLLDYQVGSPGMIANHSMGHRRSLHTDAGFMYTGTPAMTFGTAAILMATGKLGNAAQAGEFGGIIMEDQTYFGVEAYTAKTLVQILTMGDIWVRLKAGITVVQFQKAVFMNAADTDGIIGKFSNEAPAAGLLAVPNARFLSPSIQGMAVLGLSTWKGN